MSTLWPAWPIERTAGERGAHSNDRVDELVGQMLPSECLSRKVNAPPERRMVRMVRAKEGRGKEGKEATCAR